MEIKTRTISSSEKASEALGLVESLQSRFVHALEKLGHVNFEGTEWLRDDGIHGGGIRYGISDSTLLGRASVNVSQVHYDDDPNRKLGSATAISTIVHPAHPRAPSVHIHISWTELKNGAGYWRIMADLNPALINATESDFFLKKLKHASPYEFDSAVEQGERYFFIPALGRHRGSAHFYLEHYNSGEFKRDLALAHQVGIAAIDGYIELLNSIISDLSIPSDDELAAQVAYHTLYLFQVLTLDRGTTSGLLVHDQNDIGILGSLPPKVDKNLLASWRSRMPQPQEKLLDGILAALPRKGLCIIDDGVKRTLANAVRSHYQTYPEALDLQASGNTIPPTVSNHQ